MQGITDINGTPNKIFSHKRNRESKETRKTSFKFKPEDGLVAWWTFQFTSKKVIQGYEIHSMEIEFGHLATRCVTERSTWNSTLKGESLGNKRKSLWGILVKIRSRIRAVECCENRKLKCISDLPSNFIHIAGTFNLALLFVGLMEDLMIRALGCRSGRSRFKSHRWQRNWYLDWMSDVSCLSCEWVAVSDQDNKHERPYCPQQSTAVL